VAISKALRDERASIILTDADTGTGQAMARDIGATFVRLDVSSEADWDAVAAQFPKLDVQVNNAGITGF
jgi:NAD(P)-dependent dehydrogenase (short-subunit alcohol dehydrogenase family)